jgi:hypothetical protein
MRMADLQILSTRGRKAGKMDVFVVRELDEDDLGNILNPPMVLPSSGGAVKKLRTQHHNLARLIAQGVKGADICMITGYDPSRISVLKADPAFQELVAYYGAQTEEVFVDVHKRMAAVGQMALEEVQSRLEEEPEKIGTAMLMEIVDKTLGPKAQPSQGSGNGAGPLALNITFHAPSPQPTIEPPSVITIDGEPTES